MKWFKWWKKNEIDEELQGLESKLQRILVPVVPRSEFVGGLRKRLLKQVPEIELTVQPQNQALQTGLLITGGIVGGIFVVLTGVRGLVSLVGVIGLLVSWLKQNSQDSTTPSNLAH